MFLRARLFRRVSASHVFRVVSAPTGPRCLRSSSTRNPWVSNRFDSDPPRLLAAENETDRAQAPLHDLTDKQLLEVIQRTLETRSKLPKHVKRNPNNGYSRAAASIYATIYLELQRRGTQSLLKDVPEVFLYIAKAFAAAGDSKILESFIEDILGFLHRLNEETESVLLESHYRALEGILQVLASSYAVARAGTASRQQCYQVVNLCKSLLLARRPSAVRPYFTGDTLRGILMSTIALSAEWNDGNALFLEALARYIEAMPPEKSNDATRSERDDSPAVDECLGALSWHFIRLIRILLDKKMDDLSFSFLQALVQKGLIPVEAVKSSGSEPDYRVFVISVLARWCAHSGWPNRVLSLLASEDLARPELQEHYTILVNDLLSYFVVDSAFKLQQCSYLVSHVLSQNPVIELEGSLVHAFFKIAHDTDAAKAAETMFAALQPASILDRHMDYFLHGNILPWLFTHLVYQSQNASLGKRLAEELVKSAKPVDPYQRGDVIALCAAGGYFSETRDLWNRYATGPEGHMVTGHTRCMVGIVKFFKRIRDIGVKNSADANHKYDDMKGTKETILGETMNGQSASQNGTIRDIEDAVTDTATRQDINDKHFSEVAPGISDSDVWIPGTSTPTENRTAREADDLEPEASETSKISISLHRELAAPAPTCVDLEHSDPHGSSAPVARQPRVADDSVAEEYSHFALKVVDAYRSAKEPLNRASHYDLNALAHAADVLGLVRLSMYALQIIVDRKEVPDTYDLNVVIKAMAVRDPLRAEEMLLLMLQEDMHLNAVSFSAVILGWLQHRNTIHASRVYSCAIRAGYARLPSEAATALVRACLDACCSAEAAATEKSARVNNVHRTFLRQVYFLIKSRAIPKTIIPRELATRLVGAALRFEEAALAFYFWKQLVKANTQRKTGQERALRQAVAVLVKKATETGLIGTEEGRRMISELG